MVTEYKQKGISIAPNTVFPFKINLGKDDIGAGTYVLKGKGISAEKAWGFEDEFTIIKQQKEVMNKEDVVESAFPKGVTPSVIVFGIVTLEGVSILIRKFI